MPGHIVVFLCPLGAMFRVTSVFSRRHLTITPSNCTQCKLCSGSCPFDAIDRPTDEKTMASSKNYFKRFFIYLALLPAFIFLGGFAISSSHVFLAKAHPDVYLAHLLTKHPELKNDVSNLDIKTFMSSGRSMDDLVQQANIITGKFQTGGWYLGGFIGLVIGITLINSVVFRKRTDYEPNKSNCFSCGRCLKYCPVKE
ncbi:MAG: 4Fe-4S dicluster domain-containing protein [Bacteroidales bacterium]|nr:4Fe-4S dicluster domain-containing protein [Bacteroidales bacterium]